ncbi:sodium/potassium-transporting ATPase subunit beta-like [Ylistrum balloti]|uniref:sodium/potassium-transporting ATPase subunit beta-like n=1 Tax=Ylistrum balloti TaxID=509963 RepID=UPI002905E3D8|nr:sodium/potassium-transporting ATPase subunit beta-like [Ylistrum balloti]
MESKYDRVAYPENVYLHSDGEMEDFGTGVYPVSVISRKPFHDDSINFGCCKVRRKFSTLLIITGVIALLLVITISIGIHAAVTHQNLEQKLPPACSSGANPNAKDFGLLVQPMVEDSGSAICFDATKPKTFLPYLNSLDFYTHAYSTIPQHGDDYVDCTNATAPEGKKCRFDIHKLGGLCTHGKQYGYDQGRPCVLLTLKMPKGIVPEVFEKDADITKTKLQNGIWSPDHVAVTCEGATPEDKANIGSMTYKGPNNITEGPIYISPKEGFPINFYKGGNTVLPGVMVGFNDLKITKNTYITIKCVAWAKNFNNGDPANSIAYTSTFKFHLS